MGNHKEGSDVDIVLIGNVDRPTLARISSGLNEETSLPYFFDLITFGDISSSELKKHIKQHGKKIYKK